MKQAKLFLSLLPVFFLLLLAGQTPVLAEEVTLSAERDTFANEAYPDKVWGSYQVVTISNETINRFGYFYFSEPSLPEGVTNVTRAVLKLNVYEGLYGTTARVDVGPIRETWDESGGAGLTWNNRPDVWVDHTSTHTVDLAGMGWKEIDVTSIVNKWLRDEIENHGIFVYPAGYLFGTSGGDFALSVRTREAASDQPRLVLTYLPAPTPTAEPTPTGEVTPTLEPTVEPIPQAEASAPVLPTQVAEPPVEPTAAPANNLFSSLERKDIIIGAICLVLALLGGVALSFAFFKKKPGKPAGPDTEM